jgi:hypothetical protein
MDRAGIIGLVCQHLLAGDRAVASAVAREKYPFVPLENPGREFTELQMTRVFVSDGFLDRYTGKRLVFPGTLRLLSTLMPEEFPYHPNWKMSASHIVYWDLFPTIDHVMPVARGGADNETNWVTTSMLKNSAKSNWTLEELEWQLRPKGSIEKWDGLMRWYIDYTAAHPGAVSSNYLRTWRRAAVKVQAERAGARPS